ncbi:hypothetical protein LINGRAHAP2_LOCUS27364 [Linum grandiflorum]
MALEIRCRTKCLVEEFDCCEVRLGPSEWSSIWSLGSSGCSVWRWVIHYSCQFCQYGYIDPRGGRFSFWFDHWVRGVRLCDAYPRIAGAAQFLGCEVSDVCSFVDRCRWHIPLTTSLRGGALMELNHLLARLDDLPTNFISAGPAYLVWPLEKSAVFSVRSMRRCLMEDKFPGYLDFPFDTIWSSVVPTKVQAFC